MLGSTILTHTPLHEGFVDSIRKQRIQTFSPWTGLDAKYYTVTR